MSADTAGRPIATADCEPGDAVVIVPVPAPGLDAPEAVHATVTRATDAALYAETDDGERYRRDRLGHLERASERRASGLESTFWARIAHDSELRRVEADGGEEQTEETIVGPEEFDEPPITMECPGCGTAGDVPGAWEGLTIECKTEGCGERFTVVDSEVSGGE